MLLEFQVSNHSRAIKGVVYGGKRQVHIREKTRAKISAIAPRMPACIQSLFSTFSLVWRVTYFHASTRVYGPSRPACCGLRAWGKIEYSKAPAKEARYLTAPDGVALISYAFARILEGYRYRNVSDTRPDLIPLRIILRAGCQLLNQARGVIRCHSGA